MTNALSFFEQQGWYKDGAYTVDGLEELAKLIEPLPTVQRGRWGPVFVPLMSKVVPSAIELIIIQDNKVLLTHRDDTHFKGWHTPGSYIDPGEDWQAAASRTAKKELDCDVVVIGTPIKSLLKRDNPRFTDTPHLQQCKLLGEPKDGQWFSEMPEDIIPVHRQYWPYIETLFTTGSIRA